MDLGRLASFYEACIQEFEQTSRNTIDRLLHSLDQLEQERDQCKADAESWRTQAEALQAGVDARDSELASTKTELDQVKDKAARYKTSLFNLQAKNTKLAKQIEPLQVDVKQHQKAAHLLQAQVEELEKQLEVSQQELQKQLEQEKQAHADELEAAKERNREAVTATAELMMSKVRSLQLEVSQLKLELAEAQHGKAMGASFPVGPVGDSWKPSSSPLKPSDYVPGCFFHKPQAPASSRYDMKAEGALEASTSGGGGTPVWSQPPQYTPAKSDAHDTPATNNSAGKRRRGAPSDLERRAADATRLAAQAWPGDDAVSACRQRAAQLLAPMAQGITPSCLGNMLNQCVPAFATLKSPGKSKLAQVMYDCPVFYLNGSGKEKRWAVSLTQLSMLANAGGDQALAAAQQQACKRHKA